MAAIKRRNGRKPPVSRHPKFRFIWNDRISSWMRDLHVAFSKWLSERCNLRHCVTVYLLNRRSMPTYNAKFRALGGFNHRNGRPQIVVVCRRPDGYGKWSSGKMGKVYELLLVFAHEFCHYEHWRDGKGMGHRGIRRRANSLTRQFVSDQISRHIWE